MTTKTKELSKILLQESTYKIKFLGDFLTNFKNAVNDVLLSYQGLNIKSPLTLDDIGAMYKDRVTETVKQKLVSAMPENFEVAGMSLDKSKYVDLLKLPNLSQLQGVVGELTELIDSFEQKIAKDVEFNLINRFWFNYLILEGQEVKVNDSLVSEANEKFRIYASTESQINLHNALTEVVKQLNTGVIKNIPPMINNPMFHREPYTSSVQYGIFWERFFKNMLSWNSERNCFEVKIDFITKN